MIELLSKISAQSLKDAHISLEMDLFGHVEAQRRLERAYREILLGDQGYEIIHCYNENYEVKGPNGTYYVNQYSKECSCPDGEKLCKHRLAVKLITDAMELEGLKKGTIK